MNKKPVQKSTGIDKKIVLAVIAGIAVLVIFFLFFTRDAAFTSLSKKQPAAVTDNIEEAEEGMNHGGYEEPESDAEIAYTAINMNDSGFSPREVKVKSHTIVSFHNQGKQSHEVLLDTVSSPKADGFIVGSVLPGKYINIVELETPGTYRYYCKTHPDEKGTIIVTE
jgi:plastocyanin